mgnify:CR=1 FL=1
MFYFKISKKEITMYNNILDFVEPEIWEFWTDYDQLTID